MNRWVIIGAIAVVIARFGFGYTWKDGKVVQGNGWFVGA